MRGFTRIDAQFPPLIVTGEFKGRYIRMIEVAGEYLSPIFLMSLDVKDFGSIHCWNYENNKLWDAEDRGELYLPSDKDTCCVASSFSEFVDIAIPDVSRKPVVDIDVSTMEHTVENFARHGDRCFFDATAFFDKLTVDELNAGWPKDAQYPHPAIIYAVNYKQINMVKYLISRGVNVEDASRRASNLEIGKLLVAAAGNTLEVKQTLLLCAAGTIIQTSDPTFAESIVIWLTESGVQPDFSNEQVCNDWRRCINQCYSKKVLRFYAHHIRFPTEHIDRIKEKLNTRFGAALTEESIMSPNR